MEPVEIAFVGGLRLRHPEVTLHQPWSIGIDTNLLPQHRQGHNSVSPVNSDALVHIGVIPGSTVVDAGGKFRGVCVELPT